MTALGRAPAPDVVVRRVAQALRASRGAASVPWLADRAGLSERQLARRFSSQVGLGIKHAARVERLRASLRLQRREHLGWAELAAACGYADQAHLSREYKALTGRSPSVLLAR